MQAKNDCGYDNQPLVMDEVHLPVHVAAASGFEKAIIGVYTDHSYKKTGKCENFETECTKPATLFKKEILAVIDSTGKRVNYENLPPDVTRILDEVKSKIFLCWNHFLPSHKDGTLYR